MRKLIFASILVLGSLFTIPALAQNHGRDRGRGHDRNRVQVQIVNRPRYEHRYERRPYQDYNDTYVILEYRYVRFGGEVYKETYRSKYTRNGFLVSRTLLYRENVRRYGEQGNKFRFNVFLRF